ncbi:Uncharacterised protein [Mycobacterium tuberculosis]|uniref:Uncharacterized protein n=1 Tax=Mycobacterium tuberculosis TaxID=1773 RepID=A0A0T9Z655_MYCTX|nr:Uncharacterised protein [Mycobacterium tuberculosis]CKQ37511.1 Uncharacterised protein [Mycobacterium tuberculosis]CKT07957.1 Uncharacterised protein [Mycobacterium tuberculosis]CNX31050.1 Uncharacterised protein [Mycobacterium tuberculosis]COU92753.1 Uncharacterised protein [Mycobacterium tuberculosis]
MIDQIRIDSASCGVPSSGLRVRSKVNTTGSAARPTNAPVAIRSPVPSECPVSPISSGQRGNTK